MVAARTAQPANGSVRKKMRESLSKIVSMTSTKSQPAGPSPRPGVRAPSRGPGRPSPSSPGRSSARARSRGPGRPGAPRGIAGRRRRACSVPEVAKRWERLEIPARLRPDSWPATLGAGGGGDKPDDETNRQGVPWASIAASSACPSIIKTAGMPPVESPYCQLKPRVQELPSSMRPCASASKI
jgi:hypothetical protein